MRQAASDRSSAVPDDEAQRVRPGEGVAGCACSGDDWLYRVRKRDGAGRGFPCGEVTDKVSLIIGVERIEIQFVSPAEKRGLRGILRWRRMFRLRKRFSASS